MRYLVDLAVFAAVFVLAHSVFENASIALCAAVIVAGAWEVLQGAPAKR